MIDNFEKLLLLKINAQRLDYTGLTKITEDTEIWYQGLRDSMKSFTPIERIVRILFFDISDRLERRFGEQIFSYSPQVKIGKYVVDFVVKIDTVDDKYIIECDGHDFHEKTKEQVKYDKQRERFLVNSGYKVLRYSGSEIYGKYEEIIDELFSVFEKRYLEGHNGY